MSIKTRLIHPQKQNKGNNCRTQLQINKRKQLYNLVTNKQGLYNQKSIDASLSKEKDNLVARFQIINLKAFADIVIIFSHVVNNGTSCVMFFLLRNGEILQK